MGFQHGVGGINAAAKQLDVIGNNVANAGTIGFKGSRAEFADMYAANFYGVAATQTGLGVKTDTIAQQFSQGGITTTGNQLDMAISGNGFFVLKDPNGTSYSRNGQFKIDREGFLVTNGGANLMGYAVDPQTGKILAGTKNELRVDNSLLDPRPSDFNGEAIQMNLNLDSRSTPPSSALLTKGVTLERVGTTDYLKLPNGRYVDPATGEEGTVTGTTFTASSPTVTHSGIIFYVDASGVLQKYDGAGVSAPPSAAELAPYDFDPAKPSTYNHTTSMKVHDSLGNEHVLSTYYVKKPGAGEWDVHTRITDPAGNTRTLQFKDPAGGADVDSVSISFDRYGNLMSAGALALASYNPNPDIGAADLNLKIDFTGSSQFGAAFAVNDLIQPGYGPSVVTNLEISKDGVISARYSNGQNKFVGQIFLANFANQQGLQSIGNNRWIQTYQSGVPTENTPGSTNTGLIQSQALEEANVDLTAELVNMITAQRFYQANAQTIKVQDAVLQSVINLR